MKPYRGRLAPTPTGYLHVGHAVTFYEAWKRARQSGGQLIYRDEDLDPERCRSVFARAAMEDLRWLGLDWEEGPDVGGPYAPYRQSGRRSAYLTTMEDLVRQGAVYPCFCSRKDIRQAARAPQDGDEAEAIYPGTCRDLPLGQARSFPLPEGMPPHCWRFRIPDGEIIRFSDDRAGLCGFQAGVDFGDFPVWRRDDCPAYELAVVVDDHAMQISEVVRGEDLLLSTARQLLLYRAMDWHPPNWFHTPLVRDANGRRLAKRNGDLSLRELRHRGVAPTEILEKYAGSTIRKAPA